MRIRLTYERLVDTTCLRTIHIPSLQDYPHAAAALNVSAATVVSLQHEFGIFGGHAGAYVLEFLRHLRKPLVTTLHSVRPDLTPDRVALLQELCAASARIVVLTSASKEILIFTCAVPAGKISVVPHGIPNVGLLTAVTRQRPPVFVSAGHLRSSKGYEVALQALALYKKHRPDFTYVILGKPHPQSVGAIEYSEELRRLAAHLGLEANVQWRSEYLAPGDLLREIMAADIGIVPYAREHQSASGILPLLLGCGRAVVATSFACALSLREHVPSLILVPLNDPERLHDALFQLASDHDYRQEIMKANYRGTRPWLWSRTSRQYDELLHAASNLLRLAPN
jgi:glycosyltransferase involved in cell wall biosynthesis